MSEIKMIAPAVKNVPWQEKPEGLMDAPVWRYKENPIIGRNPVKGVARIFNSAVIPYEDEFIGVFRGNRPMVSRIFTWAEAGMGFTGILTRKRFLLWMGTESPLCRNTPTTPDWSRWRTLIILFGVRTFTGRPSAWRRPQISRRLPVWKTRSFHLTGMLFCFRKINGRFVLLSRPSDSGHTPFGDIFISESPDLVYWGRHRHVMGKGNEWWESLKIGGGAAPIETTEGWLLFYHGVSGTCNGYVYSIGGAILDLENPSIVKYRCENFLITPEEWYEERGSCPMYASPVPPSMIRRVEKLPFITAVQTVMWDWHLPNLMRSQTT